MTDLWRATCVQMPCEPARSADTRAEARDIMERNTATAVDMIDEAMASASPAPSLLLLPEFVIQGPPEHETVPEWIEKACYSVPGPLTEPLQKKAQEHKVYIAGNQFESDPEWEGRFFNTSFLIDPSGDIILRYRRIFTSYFCSPHDFLDKYLDRYGWEGVWPVAETPLGKIGMLACGEIMTPEAPRAMMFQGCEVLLHPSNQPVFPLIEAGKVVAAGANMMYVVSVNVSGQIGEPYNAKMFAGGDVSFQGGSSKIIDYKGRTLAFEEEAKSTLEVSAMIDIDGLREARLDTSPANAILRLRSETFARFYQDTPVYPANYFADSPMVNAHEETKATSAEGIERLRKAGIVQ